LDQSYNINKCKIPDVKSLLLIFLKWITSVWEYFMVDVMLEKIVITKQQIIAPETIPDLTVFELKG
jgi:hypothetical protein